MDRKFSEWMKIATRLSDASVYKYARAIYSISKDMISMHLISKNLYEMNLVELDFVIPIILNNHEFKIKNSRGNNMYSNALKQLRRFAVSTHNREESYQAIIKDINSDKTLSITEREAVIKSRIGQGKFRESLMKKYHHSCVVTGINLEQILVASHIKPWAVSNNHERLSSENGLLLSATFDRLFDSGLISFRDNGTIIVSHFIDEENKSRLHISTETKVTFDISSELRTHLEYHRDVIFIN